MDPCTIHSQTNKEHIPGNSAGALFGIVKNVTPSKVVGDLQIGDEKGMA